MTKHFSLISDLIKYKLSIAVVFSSVTGYFISGAGRDIRLAFLCAGVFLLASGSAALNQYSERMTDSLMERTKNRPIPSGRISEGKVLGISLALFLSGAGILFMNGIVPVVLGVLTVFLYNLVYTRLKRITILSIVPGGLVGAIPPLIGYSSGGAGIFNHDILSFSAFMFLWQVPHFWLIIVRYGEEYKKAGLATISSFLSGVQIRKLVFTWVLASNTLLLLFYYLTEAFDKQFLLLLLLINVAFILLFHRKLFGYREHQKIKGALILVNSYGLIVMLLLITFAIIQYR
jgi:protoheme IX farnesyltransferase